MPVARLRPKKVQCLLLHPAAGMCTCRTGQLPPAPKSPSGVCYRDWKLHQMITAFRRARKQSQSHRDPRLPRTPACAPHLLQWVGTWGMARGASHLSYGAGDLHRLLAVIYCRSVPSSDRHLICLSLVASAFPRDADGFRCRLFPGHRPRLHRMQMHLEHLGRGATFSAPTERCHRTNSALQFLALEHLPHCSS